MKENEILRFINSLIFNIVEVIVVFLLGKFFKIIYNVKLCTFQVYI